MVSINKLKDDDRGYYIALDEVWHLHNDGRITNGTQWSAGVKTAFWETEDAAYEFFKEWSKGGFKADCKSC